MLTTGELLKRERNNKQLTLEDIEKKTRIRKKYLNALEENDWKLFPSKTYIIGILKTYGKLLDLDETKLTAFFRREYERKEEIKFKKRIAKGYFSPETKKIFQLIVLLCIALFVIYFSYQIKLFTAPPKVEIISPTKNVFIRENKIELIGRTEKDTIVMVNNERVFLDKNNIFKITIPLVEERYLVTIEATGANGKKTIIKKEFVKKR